MKQEHRFDSHCNDVRFLFCYLEHTRQIAMVQKVASRTLGLFRARFHLCFIFFVLNLEHIIEHHRTKQS